MFVKRIMVFLVKGYLYNIIRNKNPTSGFEKDLPDPEDFFENSLKLSFPYYLILSQNLIFPNFRKKSDFWEKNFLLKRFVQIRKKSFRESEIWILFP